VRGDQVYYVKDGVRTFAVVLGNTMQPDGKYTYRLQDGEGNKIDSGADIPADKVERR
jgi:hypothetical protein